MSEKHNDIIEENLLELHEERKCKKGCKFCEEEKELKFQEANCKECLDEGYLYKGTYDQNGALVDTFKVKCPYCNFHDPYREQEWDNN